MNPDAERFIELATRPLGDNAELKLSGEAELRKAIDAENRPDALAEAVDALERADRHPRRKWWMIALYLVSAWVSLPMIIHTGGQISRSMGIGKILSPLSPGISNPAKITNLDAAQQLQLYGDDQAATGSDRWKPLWESDPGNPGYLAEYAGAYFKDHKELSPEILAAADRIDPDNGWFLAFSAVAKAEGAVIREKRSAKETKDEKAAVMMIQDQRRLDEALALLHQVAAKPRFTSYQEELLRQRIPLLPPRRDYVSQVPRLEYVTSITAPGIPLRNITHILAAGAQQSAAKGDVEGFQRIVGDWRALVTAMIEGGDTMVDLLVAKVSMASPAANFRDAAKALGLENDAVYFEDLLERARKHKDARDNRRRAGDTELEDFRKKSSILGGLAGPLLGRQVVSPHRITDEDLRPARYADHALFGRVFSGVGWAMLGALAIAAASGGFHTNRLTGRLAHRMTGLLHLRDWILLFTGGVIFPVLWYLTITRLTPLAAREWSVTHLVFIPAGGQFASFLLSLAVMPSVIASGLLARRGAVLGLAPRFPWFGWLAAVSALLSVPAFGAVELYADSGSLVFVPAAFLIGSVAAWVLSVFAFGRESHVLRRATLYRMILPARVAGMLALALLIPFHYAEEKHWIQQDRLGEISTDAPAMSRYEYEVTQILRGELLEMLGSRDKTE